MSSVNSSSEFADKFVESVLANLATGHSGEQAAPKAANPVSEKSWNVMGLGPMARVSTSFGDFPAQALRERDPVRVEAGHFVRIAKIQRICLDKDFLERHPEARPIVIRKGALNGRLPEEDLVLSPGQTLLTAQSDKRRTAFDLLDMPLVQRQMETIFTYTQVFMDSPCNLLVNGVWVPAMTVDT